MVVSRRGEHRLADPNAGRGAGRDSLHSPMRGLLDYANPLAAVDDTVHQAGGMFKGKIEDVVAFIKATTGIDLSGPAALLTLPLEMLGGAELGKVLEVLGMFIPSLSGSDPSTFDLNAAATEFIETVLNPTGLIGGLLGVAEKLTGIINPADPDAALAQWGANLRELFDGTDLNAPGLTQSAGLTSWINNGILPLNLLLGPTSPLRAGNLFGGLAPSLFRQVPLGSIGDVEENLLDDPEFQNAAPFAAIDRVEHDATRGRVSLGCIVFTPGGVLTDVYTDPAIPVSEGQVIAGAIYARADGVVSTGTPVQLAIAAYSDRDGIVHNAAASAVLAQAAAAGTSAAGTWPILLAGSYTVPAGVASIRLRPITTELITAGSIAFDSAKVAKTQKLPESSVFNLPAKLQGFDVLGMFDSTRLREFDTIGSPFRTVADLINNGLWQQTQTGLGMSTIGDNMTAIADYIRQGADGTAQTGGSLLDPRSALDGIRESLSSVQTKVAQILARDPTSSAGAGVIGNVVTDDAERPAGAGWGPNWLVPAGFNAGGVNTDGHRWYWADAGNSVRVCPAIRTDKASLTPYQSVQDVMSSVMESPQAWTGAGPNSNNWLICRSNVTGTQFVYVRRYYNRAELWRYDNGTHTRIDGLSTAGTIGAGGVTPRAGARWELRAGTTADVNNFVLLMNDAGVANWTIPAAQVWSDAAHQYAGQGMMSDTRGAGEATPGSVEVWTLSDNAPTGTVGTGLAMKRVSATNVGIGAGVQRFPASFLDTEERRTADISWDAATQTATVTRAGWYVAEVGVRTFGSGDGNGYNNLDGSTVLYRADAGATAAFRKGGHANSGGTGGTILGFWHTYVVYLPAGGSVGPGISVGAGVNIRGDAAGYDSYFTLTLTNPDF